ncbi:MAG: hypothetical protein ABI338_08760 [Gemmatimonadaceae bacterium]
MHESTNDHPEPKFVDSETALGGADAVEKTTYVVGHGTSPEAEAPLGEPASVGRTGYSPIFWIAIVVAVLIAIVYLIGIWRS